CGLRWRCEEGFSSTEERYPIESHFSRRASHRPRTDRFDAFSPDSLACPNALSIRKSGKAWHFVQAAASIPGA
ncbi:MAG: hypothetical protein AAF802_23160, partial [Planctomycetota bacterium]